MGLKSASNLSLKDVVTHAPVPVYEDYSKKFILEMGASSSKNVISTEPLVPAGLAFYWPRVAT